MQKFLYSAIGVLALALVSVLAFFMFTSPGDSDETLDNSASEVISAPAVEGEAVVAQEEAALDAPAINVQSDSADAATSGLREDVPEEAMAEPAIAIEPEFIEGSQYYGGDDFKNTAFNLNTTLPTEPTSDRLYTFNETNLNRWQLSDVKAIAERLGFTGEVYIEKIPEYAMEEYEVSLDDLSDEEAAAVEAEMAAEELAIDSEFAPFTPYVVFDGPRRLTFYDRHVSYVNTTLARSYRGPMGDGLDFEASKAKAIEFLDSTGLIDFEYTVEQGWGSEVMIKRADGIVAFEESPIMVQINQDGEVVFADFSFPPNPEVGKEFDLISAETAWQALQAEPMKYEFNYMPSNEMMEMEQSFMTPPNYWRRSYAAGVQQTIYVWPQIYQPAETDGTPLVLAEEWQLAGDADILSAIAAVQGQMIKITGFATDGEDGGIFAVESWEQVNAPRDVYLNGVIVRDGETTLLEVAGGLKVSIPDAPEDLADGTEVGVFGWSISEPEEGLPEFNWVNIDEQISFDPSFMPPMEPMGPFGMSEINFDEVGISYRHFYPEYGYAFDIDGPPEPTIIPMWTFYGESDRGETMDFYVPAIDVNLLNEKGE